MPVLASALAAAVAVFLPALAQDADPTAAIQDVNEILVAPHANDLSPARFLSTPERIESLLEKYSGTLGEDIVRPVAAEFSTITGRHDRAIEIWDGGASSGRAPVELPDDLSARDAIAMITALAEDRRVVILNEAHHVGMHREFARRLLEPLRELGFTHLACEAFNNSEPGVVTGASAPMRNFGFYTEDPVFSDFIRHAMELGFELLPYESTADFDPNQTQIERIATRERDQAGVLHAALEADENARIFVLCGYDHLLESVMERRAGEIRMMARRLADLSGLDPLTIAQVRFTPRSTPSLDGADFAEAAKRTGASDVSVLVSGDEPWVSDPGGYDLELLTPRFEPVDGRPGWLFASDDRRAVRVDTEAEAGVIVASREGEPEKAVPADVAHFSGAPGSVTLALRPGVYTLTLVEPGREVTPLGTRSVD